MAYKIVVNSKPAILRDKEALILVKTRAKREGRSTSNAIAQTVIEHLKERSQDES